MNCDDWSAETCDAVEEGRNTRAGTSVRSGEDFGSTGELR